MTTVHSPTASRRRLRKALRRARDASGLTQEQVAEAMDWSLSKVIRIETGGVGISTSDLRQLLQLYQITDEAEVADLVELARVGRQRPWWTRYRDVLPPGYLAYVGLEDESSALRIVSPTGLPGLLQTEEYAKAIMDAATWVMEVELRRQATPEMAHDRVAVRMTRQKEVLQRPDGPPEITVILDEAVLWRQIGGPDVLRRQLERLVALSDEPYMTIQVLPFRTGVINIMGYFTIMEFPDPADLDAVYVEAPFEQNVVEGEDVARYRTAFERLRQAALSPEESRELIKQIASTLH
jgi:transcriptional regulator with XRE-family HTH domain